MKNVMSILFLLIFILKVNSQGFKQVQSAQDVIDNYIEANGGADNLKSIKSIKTLGRMELAGMSAPVNIYVSERYFYFTIDIPMFSFSTALDLKEKKGWSKIGSKVTDVKDEEIDRNNEAAASMLWGYYVNKDKYGITYQLMQSEIINEKETYVVDFLKGEVVVETVYFDKETFLRVRQIKDNQMSDYSDFRNVSERGIYMPYLIKTQQGDIVISSYSFNDEFDRSLLKKPKGED
ncbi:MAG: hypothetical protein N2510_03560 [Ignavibacteria bacterium]|nr:hypothetical protein [Ignavibacteria bacterium]